MENHRAGPLLDVGFSRGSEQLIVIEIKCFSDAAEDLSELYRALGQYQFYQTALSLREDVPPLYLALPSLAYARFQNRPEIMLTLQNSGVKYVIIDLEAEVIVQWQT
jgi:hypothetical protein